jgi:pyruvate/2-oxoglutarate dehydrogenase complex dihydrolipoamide dehydrogenase (E3) component
MFERGPHLLSKDDPDVVHYLKNQMEKDGVNILFKSSTVRIDKTENEGESKVTY